jgi:hypothetical protein
VFLHDFSSEQKMVFTSLAKQLIEADGMIHEDEKELLYLLGHEMGIDVDAVLHSPLLTKVDLVDLFNTRRARAAVLLELIGLGYSDANFNAAESEFLVNLAEKFGFSQAELSSMDSWVIRQIALVKEAEQILSA